MSNGTGSVKITILVDNQAAQGLRCEHGFSAWIEVAGRRLLFDTGQGSALAGNANRLGIDLSTADILVLSHGHYDHTGGIPLLIAQSPTVTIYAHPMATAPRYALRNGVAKPIAMPGAAQTALKDHADNLRWTTQPQWLAMGLGLTGPIPRLTDFEDTGGPFFLDADGTEPDPIADDLALWMHTDQGLVVVVGCSHAGLVNTLHHTMKLGGASRLHAVIGGFHLNAASEVRLTRTMASLEELAPDLIVPCHCTGDAAIERLKQSFGERVRPGSAGAVLRFGNSFTTTSLSPWWPSLLTYRDGR